MTKELQMADKVIIGRSSKVDQHHRVFNLLIFYRLYNIYLHLSDNIMRFFLLMAQLYYQIEYDTEQIYHSDRTSLYKLNFDGNKCVGLTNGVSPTNWTDCHKLCQFSHTGPIPQTGLVFFRVYTGQENVRKSNIFKGQEFVREFQNLSGKNEIFVREFLI